MLRRLLRHSALFSTAFFALAAGPLRAGIDLVINEVDADTPGTDALEFVEIFDGGTGSTDLDGYVLVFFNGDNMDLSYAAFDLDGFATDASGYFVAGNTAVANVDLVFAGNLLQNGADAVALYTGDASSFPNGTAPTATNLVDALVYDTGDADDTGLLTTLLNPGQPQVDENAGGAAATESNQRCPNGSGGARNTTTYLRAAPSPGAANVCPAPPVAVKIHDVQGNGAISPLEDDAVIVEGIVTGVRSNGFFVQEELADYDADPATSEGVLVFTSTAPPAAAAVGNLVEVTGTVVEFVPSADPLQPALTEIVNPSVIQVLTGQTLPPPVALTATFPDPVGPHDQLERLEGMRVSASSLTVVAPTLGSVVETSATATSTGVFYATVTGVARPFREAGIPAPDPPPSGGGSIPPIPRFDSNPERIRIDSDALVGTTPADLRTGATVANLTGPLDYSFRTYTILPDPGSLGSPTGGISPSAVADPGPGEITVASYNLERFFDDVDDPGIGEPVLTGTAYQNRLGKASAAIRDYLKTPDIVGIVECENLATLQDLANRIVADAIAAGQPDPDYLAYLSEGNDVGGIDVGFLVKNAPVDGKVARVQVIDVVQERAGELFTNPDSSTELLNDRPTLRLRAVLHHPSGESFALTVMVNHLRSLNGVNSEESGSSGWPTAGARVRAKRLEQANSLADLVQERQIADPAERIVLVGDFNFFEVNDGLVHGMGVVLGTPVPDEETAVPGDEFDFVEPDLVLLQESPAAEAYSYVFDGNAQTLDHAIVNAPVVASTSARRVEHPRINADFPATDRNDYSAGNPRRLSDHDPLVIFLTVEAFEDSPFQDGFESGDTVRWSSTVPKP